MLRLSLICTGVLSASASLTTKANPIRRVVNLLEEMASEIQAEITKEKKAYEKFECYCKKNDGELGKQAAEAAALIKKTRAEVEANTGLKKQLKEEIQKAQLERKQAQKDLEGATKKRTEVGFIFSTIRRTVCEKKDGGRIFSRCV